MENLPAAVGAIPELAPALILGAVVGAGYGLYADRRADDGVPHRWWQYGGLGAVLGSVGWIALLALT